MIGVPNVAWGIHPSIISKRYRSEFWIDAGAGARGACFACVLHWYSPNFHLCLPGMQTTSLAFKCLFSNVSPPSQVCYYHPPHHRSRRTQQMAPESPFSRRSSHLSTAGLVSNRMVACVAGFAGVLTHSVALRRLPLFVTFTSSRTWKMFWMFFQCFFFTGTQSSTW